MLPPLYTPPPHEHVHVVDETGNAALIPEYPGMVLGRAYQDADGTIVLDLDDRFKNGAVMHSRTRIEPTNPDYPEIMKHFGPFKAGQERLLKSDGHGPWATASDN